MTGLLSLTTRTPLAVVLSVLCLGGIASTVTSVALDTPPAYAGVNDPSV